MSDLREDLDRRADSLLIHLAAKPWTALGLIVAGAALFGLGWLLCVLA